jgi:hypothetical protein
MIEPRIRVVVFRDGQRWIIQGLDYDFVTVAQGLEDVHGQVQRWLTTLFVASRDRGIQPFYGYTKAPRRFWRMYEEAEPWTEPFPPIEMPEGLGPAPVIEVRILKVPPLALNQDAACRVEPHP